MSRKISRWFFPWLTRPVLPRCWCHGQVRYIWWFGSPGEIAQWVALLPVRIAWWCLWPLLTSIAIARWLIRLVLSPVSLAWSFLAPHGVSLVEAEAAAAEAVAGGAGELSAAAQEAASNDDGSRLSYRIYASLLLVSATIALKHGGQWFVDSMQLSKLGRKRRIKSVLERREKVLRNG